MIDYSYARIESATYGKKGVYQTILLFALAFLILLTIGVFGPSVFESYQTESKNINLAMTTVYSPNQSWQKMQMQSFHQIMWASLTIERHGSLDGIPRRNIDLIVDVAASSGLHEELVHSMSIIEQAHIARDLTFSNNSYHSDPIYLFMLNGIDFHQYNVSLTFINASTWAGETYFPSAFITFTYFKKAFTTYEVTWKYIFLSCTLCILYFPRLGFYWRMRNVPEGMKSFEQTWISHLLLALIFFDDPLFGFQVFIQYIHFCYCDI